MKIKLEELLEDAEKIHRKQHAAELAIISSIVQFGKWVKQKRRKALESGYLYISYPEYYQSCIVEQESKYTDTIWYPDYILGICLAKNGYDIFNE